MAASAKKKPVREDMRPEIRGRNGEVLTRRDRSGAASSQFDVPTNLREIGWSMQWVRAEYFGKQDPANLTDHMENGWRPVPADRPGFAQYFRLEDGANDVRREGLILMERPESMTIQALDEDRNRALRQRNEQVEEFALSDLPAGFDKGYGKAATKVKRTVEAAPDDSYPTRQIAIGDDDD